MEYAAGDVQKGPVLLESQLKGMISNSKLHHAVGVYLSYTTYFSRESAWYTLFAHPCNYSKGLVACTNMTINVNNVKGHKN